MIYKFRMIANDENAFLREYELDESSTFLDFHSFIQNDLGYDSSQLASFFITDEQWNKGLELTLIDMENDAGPAAIPMESVKLSELLKQKKERLLYVFDIFSDRAFFIELSDILCHKDKTIYPNCVASVGEAPEQLKIEDVNLDDIYPESDDFDDIVNDIGFSDFEVDSDSYVDED
jgi:hypothetical protein